MGGSTMKKKLFALLGCMLFLNANSIPSPASAQTLSSDTAAYYSAWKETYLRKNPYVKNEDQYYVFYGSRNMQRRIPQSKSLFPKPMATAC